MASTPKQHRPKARLPRGFADRRPGEIAATRRMLETIRRTYELYGFEPVETPAIEYTDALGKFLPDLDRPNEGVFSFQDDDEQWLSLRYDLTAPLARYVAENYQSLAMPYRSYREGFVFRNEKPGPGRFRQFMQFDADTVGSSSPAADAEICMMAADTLEALGIPRGSYVIKVNNRKVLDGVMESIGLGGEENAGRRLTVLRAIDKLDRLGIAGVRQLLGEGRKDESGDFTKGAGLDDDEIDRVVGFAAGGAHLLNSDLTMANIGVADMAAWSLVADGGSIPDDCFDDAAPSEAHGFPGGKVFLDPKRRLDRWANLIQSSAIGTEGVSELAEISRLVRASGYGSLRIEPSSSVVRGLEYYTGPVFEAELTFEIKDEKGNPVRFGSVGGGGRYDGLVSRFMGQPVPATGFSIGVSRLAAALSALGKLETEEVRGPVLVTVFDRDRMADYQKMVKALREAGIRAELYLGNQKGIGGQLKYADRRGCPCAILQGSNEKAEGVVQLRDLHGIGLASLAKEREDYLRMQAEAQFMVPEEKLVEAVRDLLARHATAG